MESLVYHPSHYNKSGKKECWEEMIDTFGPLATATFDLLNAYKYLYRMGLKEGNPESQEQQKVHVYMKHSQKLILQYMDVSSEEWAKLANDWIMLNSRITKEV